MEPRRPRFLMCSPEYFGVHYVINPWMEGHVHGTSEGLADTQWQDLRTILSGHADVAVLDGASGVPDLVFTANAALILAKTAVLSSFRYKERQAEEAIFGRWLAADGYDVKVLPRAVAFEGAGDALFACDDQLLWFGHGVRSDLAALPYLEQSLNTVVKPLQLLQSRFYHLDTCFCPLERGYLLYYRQAFDAASNAAIEDFYEPEKRIAVSDEDAVNFACNAISVAGMVILNAASGELKRWLVERGFAVIETSTTEFLKAGGSTKCLTLRLS